MKHRQPRNVAATVLTSDDAVQYADVRGSCHAESTTTPAAIFASIESVALAAHASLVSEAARRIIWLEPSRCRRKAMSTDCWHQLWAIACYAVFWRKPPLVTRLACR